jgi:tetratricopeptide (TPR) repeat protein
MSKDQTVSTPGHLPVILICLGLAAITFGAFGRACVNGFVDLDDPVYVTENRAVQSGLNIASIGWAFTAGHASNWHPLTWVSLELDHQFFGLKPWGYHLTSVLLHAVSSVLLFLALWRMTGALWRSAAVAALFAWHPLHVESVAWVAERKDVLCGLFWMLTLLEYTRYVKAPGISGYLLVTLWYVAALLSKPMAVTLPFVLLLLDYWPLRRFRFAGREEPLPIGKRKLNGGATIVSWRRLIVEKLPWIGLAAASSAVTLYVQDISGAVRSFAHLPLQERVTNALAALFVYTRKVFFPFDLAAFYPYHHSSRILCEAGLGTALLMVFCWYALKELHRRPYIAVGGLWYLGTLVPVIGLVQVGNQALADRYTYIPLIGLFIILAWGLYDVSQGWAHRTGCLVSVATAALLVCLATTWIQIGYWHDERTLWEHAFRVTSDNYVAHNNRGVALLREAQTLSGPARLEKLAGAERHLAEAVHIEPAYAKAQTNLATIFDQEGNADKAMRALAASLRLDPNQEWANYLMATLLAKQGRLDYAVEHFQAALALNPKNAQAHNELGKVLARQEKLDGATEQFREAVRLEPEVAEGYYNLALVEDKQGKYKRAIGPYRETIRLEPGNIKYRCDLARALYKEELKSEAMEHYRQALKQDPRWPQAFNRAARQLATHREAKFRNGAQAVQLAEEVCQATDNQEPQFLDTLAAAYAEAGRFPEAVATAEMALKLAKEDFARPVRERLMLYQKGQPYREP